MAIFNSIMNPVRFYNTGTLPDYSTHWPNTNNQNPNTKWVEGEKAVNWYRQHLINEAIIFQIAVISGSSNDIWVYKYNESLGDYSYLSTISGVDISPSGWLSDTRLLFTYTPTSEGLYYFNMAGQSHKSHPFIVTTDSKYVRRLLPISFTNSENAYGLIFQSDYETEGSYENVFTPTIYFDGILRGGGGTEISGYAGDGGSYEKTRSTVIDMASLELCEVHKSYDKFFNRLFACDGIAIAGIEYENEKAPEFAYKEGTDLMNVSVQLREKVTSNYY